MALDVNQHRLDRVTDESNNILQEVHRTLPIPTGIRLSWLPSLDGLARLRHRELQLGGTWFFLLMMPAHARQPRVRPAGFVMRGAYHATSTPCSGCPAVG